MLPGPIPIQCVEAVAGWIAEVVEEIGRFDHLQAYEGTLLDIGR